MSECVSVRLFLLQAETAQWIWMWNEDSLQPGLTHILIFMSEKIKVLIGLRIKKGDSNKYLLIK